jgi:hypothetical protein
MRCPTLSVSPSLCLSVSLRLASLRKNSRLKQAVSLRLASSLKQDEARRRATKRDREREGPMSVGECLPTCKGLLVSLRLASSPCVCLSLWLCVCLSICVCTCTCLPCPQSQSQHRQPESSPRRCLHRLPHRIISPPMYSRRIVCVCRRHSV